MEAEDAARACASLQAYENAIRVLELHGLGAQTYDREKDEAGFNKSRLQDLAAAAREFLWSLRAPSWFFVLSSGSMSSLVDGAGAKKDEEDGDGSASSDEEKDVDEAADKSQKSKKTRPRCEYRESPFDGNPPIPIANSKALNAQVRGLLAKSAHGDRDVRLKPAERANSIAVVGECSKQSCADCSWRLMATLWLQEDGTPWLKVKCRGKHGKRSRPKGCKMWAPAEIAAIKTAHPNGTLLSSRSASGSERGWLYFAGTEGSAEAICDTRKPKMQRGQAGGSEARRAGASGGRGSVVAEASGDLRKCRVGGTVSRGESCGVGHAFFGCSCRGFLNHAVNPKKEAVCIVVDGKHKITTTGA